MHTAFLIHGSGGNKYDHWRPWLKEQLEARGLRVFLPQFPIGKEQTLRNWLKVLEPLKEHLEGSIMIGHSLGVPFILNVLNQWDKKIHAAFLVAGFVGELRVEGEYNLDDFAEQPFDWEKIKKQCGHFCVIHSDNDPYIPLERAEVLAKKLDTEVVLVRGGAHFQASAGYTEFPLLLEKIDALLKP